MKLFIAVMVIGLLSIASAMTEAQTSFSRESLWPAISSYSDMHAGELGVEIALMRKDLEYFSQRSDPKSQRLANEARNRLNLLFQLYAARTGRSLESVLKMYGYPTGRSRRENFGAYDRMTCPELERERHALRKDLVRLQHPSRIDDPDWNEASSRYGLVNQLIIRKCRPLSMEEQEYPGPPQVALMPEKQLVDVAMRAIKNGRARAGESLLLQGSLAGYPSAQFNLGMVFYLLGRTDASERWLRSAAQQGHQDAARMLESIRARKKK
jgi:hypothetical protein